MRMTVAISLIVAVTTISSLPGDDENPFVTCGPGNVKMISHPQPEDTAFGRAGLLLDEPGCYALGNDISVSDNPRYAILITSPRVLVDLSGFTLSGDTRYGIGVVDAISVTIRNGTMAAGRDGIIAFRSQNTSSLQTSLRIEQMTLNGSGSSSYNAIQVFDVKHFELAFTAARGIDLAVLVAGATSGKIQNNIIQASDVALSAVDFQDGTVESNFLSADAAMILGPRNRIIDNTVQAGPFGGSGVDLRGGGNHFINNVINAFHPDRAVVADGSGNIIQGNLIRGGLDVALHLRSGGNIVDRNLIGQSVVGVLSAGENRLSRNVFFMLECALKSIGELNDRLRRNTFVEVINHDCESDIQQLSGPGRSDSEAFQK